MDAEDEVYIHTASFKDAAREARWLSRLIRDETGVKREGKLWAVIAPVGTLEALTTRTATSNCGYEPYEDEERDIRVADFSSDQDDWSRSDEDGWFYED